MSRLLSIGIDPPQPVAPMYGIDALYRFRTYDDRKGYFTANGEQAPPWNDSYGTKRWRVDNVQGAEYTFKYFDATTKTIKTMSLPAVIASEVNLVGLYEYPKYVQNPSPSTVVQGGVVVGSVPLNYLSTEADANALAGELGVALKATVTTNLGDYLGAGGLVSVVWNGETRRVWEIQFNTLPYKIPAAHLLELKYAKGIGYPGRWELDPSDNSPTWQSASVSSGASSAKGMVPVPIRDLLANETIVPNLFSALVMKTQPTAPPTGGGTGFSPEVLELITKIGADTAACKDMLTKMLAMAGNVGT